MSITRDRSLRYTALADGSSSGYLGTDYTNVRNVVCNRTRTGQNVPRWRALIANGDDATSPLSAEYVTVKSKPGFCFQRYVYRFGGGVPDCLLVTSGATAQSNDHYVPSSYLGAYTTDVVKVDTLARQDFYKKLKNTQQQFSAGTFFGEFDEVLHMLHRPAQALYDSANGYLAALSKRKRSNPRAWTKEIGGLWLEYSFGWLPFIADMKDAAAALKRLGQPRTSVRITGSANLFSDRTQDVGAAGFEKSIITNRACYLSYNSRMVDSCRVKYTGGIKAQAEMTQWDNWHLFGFNPSDVIPTAWELLPWSFLVDYFSNVGDVLSSECVDRSSVYYANRTITQTLVERLDLSNDPLENSPIGPNFVLADKAGSPGFAEFTRKTINRTSGLGQVPLPELTLEFGLSGGQLGNIAALLTNAIALHPQSYPNRRKVKYDFTI